MKKIGLKAAILRGATALGAALLALAGCASNASAPGGAGAGAGSGAGGSSGAPTQKVRVVLDWTPNTDYTCLYVADKHGDYKKAGIDLELVGFSEAGPEAVMDAKGADFGFSSVDSLLTAHASGINLKMVLNLYHKSSYGVAVPKDSPITRPKDLDGKTLATFSAGANHYSTIQMIKNDGGRGTFDQVVIGTGDLDAVMAGRADFAEELANWQGTQMDLAGTPVRFMFPEDYGVPANPAMIGISARDDLITGNPELVRKFVQATQSGCEYALAHPEESAQILVDSAPEANIDPELAKRSQEQLSKTYWPDGTGSVGHADMEAWQKYIDYLLSSGVIHDAKGKVYTDKVAASDLATNEFLK